MAGGTDRTGNSVDAVVEQLAAKDETAQEADAPRSVVLLVHGIRTRGEWMEPVVQALGTRDRLVKPIRYDYWDIARFLLPIPALRTRAITRVLENYHAIARTYPNARISVIAHSFGTYILSRILRVDASVRFDSVILCGSIVPEGFGWEWVPHMVRKVVNDVGTRDIWPICAKLFGVGYGASGRFGFGHSLVMDRFWEADHCSLLNGAFAQANWAPVLDGDRQPPRGDATSRRTPWVLSVLASPIARIGLLLGAALMAASALDLPALVTRVVRGQRYMVAVEGYITDSFGRLAADLQRLSSLRATSAGPERDAKLADLARRAAAGGYALASQEDLGKHVLALTRDAVASTQLAIAATAWELVGGNEEQAIRQFQASLGLIDRFKRRDEAARISEPHEKYEQIQNSMRGNAVQPSRALTEAEVCASLAKRAGAAPTGAGPDLMRRAHLAWQRLTSLVDRKALETTYAPEPGGGLSWALSLEFKFP